MQPWDHQAAWAARARAGVPPFHGPHLPAQPASPSWSQSRLISWASVPRRQSKAPTAPGWKANGLCAGRDLRCRHGVGAQDGMFPRPRPPSTSPGHRPAGPPALLAAPGGHDTGRQLTVTGPDQTHTRCRSVASPMGAKASLRSAEANPQDSLRPPRLCKTGPDSLPSWLRWGTSRAVPPAGLGRPLRKGLAWKSELIWELGAGSGAVPGGRGPGDRPGDWEQ